MINANWKVQSDEKKEEKKKHSNFSRCTASFLPVSYPNDERSAEDDSAEGKVAAAIR